MLKKPRHMVAENIKRCLEENITLWKNEADSLPKIEYDEDMCEGADLHKGRPDKDGRIQWHYAPADRTIDFSEFEKEHHVKLPEDLKEFYNAYFFLELRGFIGGECIMFDPLYAEIDVLENLEAFLSGEEDDDFGTTDFIVLGVYAQKYLFGIAKSGKGRVVALTEDGEQALAESLGGLFEKLEIGSPRQEWHSVLKNAEQSKDDSSSFIGGKPCIPADIPLPVCKVCGDPLTFFFQVAFPKGHMWEGKSLALFFCDSTYYKHDGQDWFPPVMLADDGADLPAEALEPENYQNLFRAYFFDTKDGVLREDYKEKVKYQRIDWKEGRRRDKKIPIILAGEPIWMNSYQRERPRSCGGKKLELVLQVADNFNFEIYPDAPAELEKNYMGKNPPFKPREENNYTLFCDFNRVFLWGTADKENPVFGINVQNDI